MAERSSAPVRALLVLGAVLVGLFVLVVLFTLPLGTSAPNGSTIVVAGHPLLDEPAPDFELATLGGERVVLSDLRGHPLLINFWATWCVPCREEFPLMVAAYDRYADDGLEILGIVHQDSADGARAFAGDLGAGWPMLLDPDDAAWEAYKGVGMPTSFFVDADGIVRAFSLGGFDPTSLEVDLARILPPGAVGSEAPVSSGLASAAR